MFITGGTGGIGRPLVRLLQKSRAVVDIYDQQTHGDLLANLDSVCSALACNPPEILINMAGYNSFARCEDQDVKALLDINLTAPIRITQAVLPRMKKQGAGHIVNMGSMVGLIPLPHMTVYAASKAGLKAFSDALRREVAGTGVAVTVISPRAVKTAANHGLLALLNSKTNTQEDDPDLVAARILKAIIKKENDVRIGWPERLYAVLNVLRPAMIDAGLHKNRLIGETIISAYKNQKENNHETNLSSIRSAAS